MVKLAFHLLGRENNWRPHSFVASDSEILKIEHSALNRSTFASGAIKAAEFIYDMSPGFYNMYDVIDFQIKKHE